MRESRANRKLSLHTTVRHQLVKTNNNNSSSHLQLDGTVDLHQYIHNSKAGAILHRSLNSVDIFPVAPSTSRLT
jgi:hypothetical protein